MSIEAMNWAYKLPLTGGVKPVLVALASFADEDHTCYPGQERIAFMVGQTARSVRTHLATLEERGLLVRERRFDPSGHRRPDRYTLAVPTGNPVRLDPPAERPLPETDVAPTGNICRGTVRELPVSTSTPLNPSQTALALAPPQASSPDGEGGGDDGFGEWWREYPRKVEKKGAKMAYRRALKDTTPAVLLAGAAAYRRLVESEKRPRSKIKHPTTWLNQGCWDDEQPAEVDPGGWRERGLDPSQAWMIRQ